MQQSTRNDEKIEMNGKLIIETQLALLKTLDKCQVNEFIGYAALQDLANTIKATLEEKFPGIKINGILKEDE